ncbi:MAG: DUF480 domain-containing protein [Acidimicrobiales bacterium]
MHLDATEGRVVGCLIEKQLTTPQQYPLTRNALVLACNQSSNREPVVALAEQEVADALDRLKDQRLVRFVLPSHGRSVVRHRHVLDEVLGLDPPQLALLAVLLLRGPQTAAELRSRAERMAEVGSVEHDLGLLVDRPEPLVERQPRRPGEREERWAVLMADLPVGAPGGSPCAEAVTADGAVRAVPADLREEVLALRADVGALAEETAALRAALAELRDSLGG